MNNKFLAALINDYKKINKEIPMSDLMFQQTDLIFQLDIEKIKVQEKFKFAKLAAKYPHPLFYAHVDFRNSDFAYAFETMQNDRKYRVAASRCS